MGSSPNVPVPGVIVTLSGNTSPGQGGGMPECVRELVESAAKHAKDLSNHGWYSAALTMRALVAVVESHYAKEVR